MILILFLLFIIADIKYLEDVPGLNYYDELLTCIGLFFVFIHFKKWIKKRSPERVVFLSITMVFFLGLVSSLHFHYQPEFEGIWRDALAIIKYPLCYIGFYKIFEKKNKDRFIGKLSFFCKIYITIILIAGIVNLYLVIPDFTDDTRYGFPLFRFIYTHSTYLVASELLMIAILISNGLGKNKIFIIMGLITIILTFRSKPIMTTLFLILAMNLRKGRIGYNLSKKKIIACGIAIVLLGGLFVKKQVDLYIGFGDTAARSAYYINGFEIASKNFPLGSGFCTFASSLAQRFYSPLYYKYQMNYIWGMTEEDGSYAADTFWPNIFTQYGYIGLLFYLIMLYGILKSINKRFFIMSDKWIAATSLLFYAVTASFAEAFLTNDTAATYAISMAIFLGNDNKREQNENNGSYK